MNWPHYYNAFFAGLRGVVSNGAGSWEACCPAHDDSKPSLSIKIGSQDKLIFRCHAKHACSQEDILNALGLTWDDCFPDNRANGGSRGESQQTTRKKASLKHIDTYQYRNGEGVLAYEVLRYIDTETSKKTFRQRRPNDKFNDTQPPGNDNPEWLYNMHEVTYYPYRYPELRNALKEKPDRFILIVEGEKDVESWVKLGIVATTNAMGAGKWYSDYNPFFAGVNVVVIPDEDDPDPKAGRRVGLDHARHVCESLLPVAASVRLLRLFPESERTGGKDSSDWLASQKGKTVREIKRILMELVKECQPWQPQDTKPKQNECGTSLAPSSAGVDNDVLLMLEQMLSQQALAIETVSKVLRAMRGVK